MGAFRLQLQNVSLLSAEKHSNQPPAERLKCTGLFSLFPCWLTLQKGSTISLLIWKKLIPSSRLYSLDCKKEIPEDLLWVLSWANSMTFAVIYFSLEVIKGRSFAWSVVQSQETSQWSQFSHVLQIMLSFFFCFLTPKPLCLKRLNLPDCSRQQGRRITANQSKSRRPSGNLLMCIVLFVFLLLSMTTVPSKWRSNAKKQKKHVLVERRNLRC